MTPPSPSLSTTEKEGPLPHKCVDLRRYGSFSIPPVPRNAQSWRLFEVAGSGRMGSACGWRLAVPVVMMIATLSPSCILCFPENDYLHCESLVRNWAELSLDANIHEDKLILKDLLFFLHVPRTGGRSYFYCFLRNLYGRKQECPRSYDRLHFDPSKSRCRVMATHDDYSLMSKLPKEKTSVVTVLRSPVDRVLSTYEFAMEVAARFLVHPNLTSALQMSIRLRPKQHGVSTLDIWPWKHLVPWMREDLFARREARKQRSTHIDGNRNPYDMKEIVMPLEDFINEPIAHDIVHNGATFQIAGLTNNSRLPESHEVRHCVSKHPVLGYYVLEVSKRRLDNMLYIGLTEEHKKSAILFANMVGAQVLSQLESTPEERKSTNEFGDVSGMEHDVSDQPEHSRNEEPANFSSSKDFPANEIVPMTVHKLMDKYENCTSNLRRTQGRRRTLSFENVAPANFSKEVRKMVPERIIQQILLLNNLDVELYEHAKHIFFQQQKHLNQSLPLIKYEPDSLLHDVMIDWGDGFSFCGIWTLNNILISAAFVASASALWYAVATIRRRRTSKLKV